MTRLYPLKSSVAETTTEQLSLIAVKKKKSWRLFAAVSMDCYIHAKVVCQEVLLTPLKSENMAMIS